MGLATVWAFVWWLCVNTRGPRLTLSQLRGLKDGAAAVGAAAAPASGHFANGFTVAAVRNSKARRPRPHASTHARTQARAHLSHKECTHPPTARARNTHTRRDG